MTDEKIVFDDEKERSLESTTTNKWNAVLWYSYDMADTFFSHTVISLSFTPFALLLGAKFGWSLAITFVIVSAFMAFSNLLIAVFGPFLGALSDTAGKRKPAVITVATIMIITTALMAVWDNFWWACILFVIANFCYQAGRMFYDSQIPFIADVENRSMIQAIGGGLAAFGSLIGTGLGLISNAVASQPATEVNTAIWELGSTTIEEINYQSLRIMLAAAAVLLIIMCIPYLFHKEVQNPKELTRRQHFDESFKAFKHSIRTVIKDKNSILFFLGWFFMVDAANTTILYMVPVIEGAAGITNKTITYLIIGVGVVLSILFGVVTGKILERLGPKKTFLISSLAWMIAVICFMLAGLNYKNEIIDMGSYNLLVKYYTPSWIAFIGAFFIGIGFGSIWILGRQFIMVLAPPSKLAQYNGIQKIAGRVSAIVSPLIFSGMMLVGQPLGSNIAFRLALGSILFFFVIGFILVTFIIDPYKRYMAGERAPYPKIYEGIVEPQ